MSNPFNIPWNPMEPMTPTKTIPAEPKTKWHPKNRIKNYLEPMFRVLLHNDDVNSMEHVIRSLVQVFGFNLQEAVPIMMEAHSTGVALCKVESKSEAELHREQLQALSLTATVEPEE